MQQVAAAKPEHILEEKWIRGPSDNPVLFFINFFEWSYVANSPKLTKIAREIFGVAPFHKPIKPFFFIIDWIVL